MRNSTSTFFALIFVLVSQPLIGQEKIDNYSFFKLYVTNQKGEVLLVKWDDNWEIAGDRYNEPRSITDFLSKVADDMGIKISDPKLCGLYTQRWKDAPNLSIMNYYKATYSSGDLKIPPDCADIRWFSFNDAMKMIPYGNMVRMMKEIQENPGKIIGAAFERYKDDQQKTQFTLLEDWHIMN